MFACAGDDHTLPGSVRQLEIVSLTLACWGAVVSEEKYGISKKYIHYCSDYALTFRPLKNPYNPIMEGAVFKVDTIMIRLLTDCRKVSPGSFEEPDPFSGKIKTLTERILWIGRINSDRTKFYYGRILRLAWYDLLLLLFSQGLGRWCPSRYFREPRSYVASHLGGRGLPPMERLEEVLDPATRWMVTSQSPAAISARKATLTRRSRGVVLTDEDDRQLYSEKLNLPMFSMMDITELARLEDLHEAPSQTAISSRIRSEFVNADAIDMREHKVNCHLKFFEGKDKNLSQKDFVTYFARHRNITQLSRLGFEQFMTRATGEEADYHVNDSDHLKTALVRFPNEMKKFIRRKDVDDLFPPSRVPDLTLQVAFLGGTQELRTLASLEEYDLDAHLGERLNILTELDQQAEVVIEESIAHPDSYYAGIRSPYRNLDEVLVSIQRDRARRAGLHCVPELTGDTVSTNRSETSSVTTTSWCEGFSNAFLRR
jgi:hypothetical protein